MKCFYIPGTRTIIDTIGSSGLSSICQESLEQIQQRYPGAEVWDFDAAVEQIQALTYQHYITAPKEIDFDRWDEMLNILPPMKWSGGNGSESFMLCEATALDLHSIFCRVGDRYFEMTDRRSLSHEDIVSACLKVMQ